MLDPFLGMEMVQPVQHMVAGHWFVVVCVAVVEVADQNLVLEAKKLTKMHRFYNLKYCIANN